MAEPTITKAVITPSDRDKRRYQAAVEADFDDGQHVVVLTYYDDELFFTADEFVGLTQREVRELFMEKDMAYLRS